MTPSIFANCGSFFNTSTRCCSALDHRKRGYLVVLSKPGETKCVCVRDLYPYSKAGNVWGDGRGITRGADTSFHALDARHRQTTEAARTKLFQKRWWCMLRPERSSALHTARNYLPTKSTSLKSDSPASLLSSPKSCSLLFDM